MDGPRLRRILHYLKPHRRIVLMGAVSLVVVNLLGVSLPLIVRNAVDALHVGFALSDVLQKAGLIIALATVMGLVRLWSRILVFGVGRQVEADLKQRIFDHLLLQEPGWVQSTGSGEVISRATSDVENVRRLLGFAVLSLTNTALAYALTLPAMLAIDPLLTLAAVGLYPLMLLVVRLFGGRMMKQQRRQQEALAQLSDLIQEDLSGIGAIKIYGQELMEQEAFEGRNRLYRDAALKLGRTRATLFPLLEGIASVSLLLLLAIGSGQIESGRLTIGDLVALILFVERLVFPTALLGFTLNSFQTGQVSLDRIEALLQRESLVDSPLQPTAPVEPARGVVEARGLTVRYPGAEPVAALALCPPTAARPPLRLDVTGALWALATTGARRVELPISGRALACGPDEVVVASAEGHLHRPGAFAGPRGEWPALASAPASVRTLTFDPVGDRLWIGRNNGSTLALSRGGASETLPGRAPSARRRRAWSRPARTAR